MFSTMSLNNSLQIVWCYALYLLHIQIRSQESRFHLFGLLTNSSTQRICPVAAGGRDPVTLRSLVHRLVDCPTQLDIYFIPLHNAGVYFVSTLLLYSWTS